MKIKRVIQPLNQTLDIYDPALCCSSGVCGVDADQILIQFSADIQWLKQQGIVVNRYNLAHQPMAFAEHPVIKAFLQQQGVDQLPVLLLDDTLALAGRYPTREELARWFGVALTGQASSVQTRQSSGCC